MKKRLTNKLFLTAIAGLFYQVFKDYHIAPELMTHYQEIIDALCYALMGFGIYSTFDGKEDDV